MLYDARMSGAPMLLTAGQHDQAMNLTEPILWSDLPPVARPYVKWSHEITRLEDLPRAVRRAVKTAHAHPSGPVFISLPVDVLNAERELDLLASTRIAPRIGATRAPSRPPPTSSPGQAARHRGGRCRHPSTRWRMMAEVAEPLGARLRGVRASTCRFPSRIRSTRGRSAAGPADPQHVMGHDLLFSVGGDLFRSHCPRTWSPCRKA